MKFDVKAFLVGVSLLGVIAGLLLFIAYEYLHSTIIWDPQF